jgi:hypothetical protein
MKPRIVPTLETKLNIIADFEAEKEAINIRREHGILPTTVRIVVGDRIINMLQNKQCLAQINI